mgnify:CR=1 FL=1
MFISFFDIFASPDERVPVEKYIELEEIAADMTKDQLFGFHLGQITSVGNWTILGYMMMNCKTIEEAFDKYVKYSSVIGNLIVGVKKNDGENVIIFLETPEGSPKVSRHCYEGYISSLISLGRYISGTEIYPIEVGLTTDFSEDRQGYEEVFGRHILYGQSHNYFILPKAVMNSKGLFSNDNLLKYFEEYANKFLEPSLDKNSVAYLVKKRILANLDQEGLSLQIIANELNMSVRNLQMQLKRDNTEFSTLLKEVRLELAKKHLDENYTVEDITYMVGFSDSSAFRKAFKSWTGMTPREYRERVS